MINIMAVQHARAVTRRIPSGIIFQLAVKIFKDNVRVEFDQVRILGAAVSIMTSKARRAPLAAHLALHMQCVVGKAFVGQYAGPLMAFIAEGIVLLTL
jgi:hypothetical protein